MVKIPGGNFIRKFFVGGKKPEAEEIKEMRLLIVDDEERFLYSTEKLLNKKGYDVSTASSGRQCLDILGKEHIHVVILDIRMPGMDGLEALRRIKQDHPLVEVILLTGHATVEAAVEGLKCGASDFLMKPISISDLIERVNNAFDRRRVHDSRIAEARSRRFMRSSPMQIIRDINQSD
jgi:DNA-binding NtrC family response regulator